MIVAFFVVAGLLNQGNALYVNSCICYTASFRFGCFITKISSSQKTLHLFFVYVGYLHHDLTKMLGFDEDLIYMKNNYCEAIIMTICRNYRNVSLRLINRPIPLSLQEAELLLHRQWRTGKYFAKMQNILDNDMWTFNSLPHCTFVSFHVSVRY